MHHHVSSMEKEIESYFLVACRYSESPKEERKKSSKTFYVLLLYIYFFFFVNFWFVASRVQKFINLLKLIKFIDTNKKHGIFLDSRMKKV